MTHYVLTLDSYPVGSYTSLQKVYTALSTYEGLVVDGRSMGIWNLRKAFRVSEELWVEVEFPNPCACMYITKLEMNGDLML